MRACALPYDWDATNANDVMAVPYGTRYVHAYGFLYTIRAQDVVLPFVGGGHDGMERLDRSTEEAEGKIERELSWSCCNKWEFLVGFDFLNNGVWMLLCRCCQRHFLDVPNVQISRLRSVIGCHIATTLV